MTSFASVRRVPIVSAALVLLAASCAGDDQDRLRAGDCLEPGFDAIALDLGFLEFLGPEGAEDNAQIYPLVQDGFLNPVGALDQEGFVNAESNCAGDPLAATRIVIDARFSPVQNGYGSFPVDCAPYGFPEWGELGDFYRDVPSDSAADIICLGPF
jgi:hypothetical protein